MHVCVYVHNKEYTLPAPGPTEIPAIPRLIHNHTYALARAMLIQALQPRGRERQGRRAWRCRSHRRRRARGWRQRREDRAHVPQLAGRELAERELVSLPTFPRGGANTRASSARMPLRVPEALSLLWSALLLDEELGVYWKTLNREKQP